MRGPDFGPRPLFGAARGCQTGRRRRVASGARAPAREAQRVLARGGQLRDRAHAPLALPARGQHQEQARGGERVAQRAVRGLGRQAEAGRERAQRVAALVEEPARQPERVDDRRAAAGGRPPRRSSAARNGRSKAALWKTSVRPAQRALELGRDRRRAGRVPHHRVGDAVHRGRVRRDRPARLHQRGPGLADLAVRRARRTRPRPARAPGRDRVRWSRCRAPRAACRRAASCVASSPRRARARRQRRGRASPAFAARRKSSNFSPRSACPSPTKRSSSRKSLRRQVARARSRGGPPSRSGTSSSGSRSRRSAPPACARCRPAPRSARRRALGVELHRHELAGEVVAHVGARVDVAVHALTPAAPVGVDVHQHRAARGPGLAQARVPRPPGRAPRRRAGGAQEQGESQRRRAPGGGRVSCEAPRGFRGSVGGRGARPSYHESPERPAGIRAAARSAATPADPGRPHAVTANTVCRSVSAMRRGSNQTPHSRTVPNWPGFTTTVRPIVSRQAPETRGDSWMCPLSTSGGWWRSTNARIAREPTWTRAPIMSQRVSRGGECST